MRAQHLIVVVAICGIGLLRQSSVPLVYATGPALKGTSERSGAPQRFLPAAEGSGRIATTELDPWTDSQVQQPADLARVLLDPKSKKPLIVCVGFEFLYRSAHVPRAVFHGPAGKPEGLENLKKWAETVPRNRPIVLYCGCCPWKHCPNIRPAFKALHDMGFARLKVLFLGTDLARDWVEKGFPIEKGR